MKSDQILERKVNDALRWELMKPTLEIKAVATQGVITLSGKTDNYVTKVKAEAITRNIFGVKSILDNIDITTNAWDRKNDFEIKSALLNIFKWNWNTLNETISVTVCKGWVTLSGELEWSYQKEAAKAVASNLIGVKGVINLIRIISESDREIKKETVENALRSHIGVDATNIKVTVSDHDLTLSGKVDSWFQKELAGRIAWKAPGVFHVNNELSVEEE